MKHRKGKKDVSPAQSCKLPWQGNRHHHRKTAKSLCALVVGLKHTIPTAEKKCGCVSVQSPFPASSWIKASSEVRGERGRRNRWNIAVE
jgi:hypothetical protein